MRKFVTLLLCYFVTLSALAQIGEHRNDFAIGINGGYQLSNVGFVPRVSQGLLGGFSGGLSMRYVCEKYFNTICSVQGEVNFAQAGWKESILDEADQPVINATTELPEEYSRTINYVQVPIFAHLAWGREQRGAQFFFQVGPQFGYYLSESTKSNFNWEDRNMYDRVNPTCAQDTMAVEHKFDYGPLPARRPLLLRTWQHLWRHEARLLRQVEPRQHRREAHLAVRYHQDEAVISPST